MDITAKTHLLVVDNDEQPIIENGKILVQSKKGMYKQL